eukprot:CAMPEP_0184874278 /NCGR_PEP_ID=MMETSP0580-20130426/42305_1 /TAXON_ID=1118495 /ORGANISM="Dactyliosolen fragilissimus" /LENGTH=145 /DNA_ID=CAMNT_0027377271 /DNA_START=327 /DNA_END=764 /DNA_ORIENTATION=+
MTANASREFEFMKRSLELETEKYEKERQATVDLTRDMTRQYKGMHDHLLNKINSREQIIQDLRDELETRIKENEKALRDKDSIISKKKKDIESLKNLIDSLCSSFAQMLSNASNQLREKIEVSSGTYNETFVPIQLRMEEFNFKA